MRTILKWLLLASVVLLAVGLFLPSQVRVERSIIIDAPTNVVFDMVNGFTRFHEWSPWHAMDPQTQYQLEGPTSGVGATLIWSSEVTGSGRQTVVEVEANRVVEVSLLFDGEAPATATYLLVPRDSGTELTWVFETTFGYDLFARYFGLLFDRLIGADYENGLANLKVLLEREVPDLPPDEQPAGVDKPSDGSSPAPAADSGAVPADAHHTGVVSDIDMEVTEVEPISIAMASGIATVNSEDVAVELSRAYQKIATHLLSQGLKMGSPPVSITRGWIRSGEYSFDAGVPVNPDRMKPSSEVKLGSTPGGRVLKATHVGSYESLSETYQAMFNYMSDQGLIAGEFAWEAYVDDPASTPVDQLQTIIYYQLAQEAAAP
ncbi:MAG: transcriptional regulator [Lysobacteraceae bacterium]|nr:MAG: transcriptional regulator [Xanthomonadaceae bacterium]